MILDEIVSDKRKRLEIQKQFISEEEMKEMALASNRVSFSFYEALKKPGLSIIGEFKKASPSMGKIANKIELTDRIDQYNQSVDAISCLTEEDHFNGSADYLKQIRKLSDLPILRKDFIIDPYQIYEAKVIGADAILLIAAILELEQMRSYYQLAKELGMDVLLEVHDEEELQRAISIGANIIGVNNRNLKDFTIHLSTTKRLSLLIPEGVLFVAESGITGDEDVKFLSNCKVNAFLIGRAFMEAEQPKELAKHWKHIFYQPEVKICGITTMEEAFLLHECKADYIGIVLFYEKSKRNVPLDECWNLLRALPPFVKKVAVTVSPTVEQVELIEKMGFDLLQVHGTLSKEVLEFCKLPIFRAIQEGEEKTPEEHKKIAAYLLDAKEPGSGTTFDWKEQKNFNRRGKKLILAGGLNQQNVREAIEILKPDIVDVSSYVEGKNGKDQEKINAFIRKVKGE